MTHPPPDPEGRQATTTRTYYLEYRTDEDPGSTEARGPWYELVGYVETDAAEAELRLAREQMGSPSFIHWRLGRRTVVTYGGRART